MSTTVSDQATRPATPTPTNTLERSANTATSPWSRLQSTPAATLIALALGLVFLYYAFQPLWHTDLWGHLAYGRLIHNTGAIPATEPLMPLSEGIPFVDTAWLSQLIGFETMRTAGVAGLQFLYAAGLTLCAGLLSGRVWQRTHNVTFVLLAMGLFLWIGWQHNAIVRPQLAGLVCFVSLFTLLTARHWSRANWFFVPALFALWANLHGSFLVGLCLPAALCIGRGCDVLRRTDRFAAVVGDRTVRRYFLLTELAAVAVLLNPYGIQIYASAIAISGNPNLTDIVEWEPMTLRTNHGQAAAIVALALVMLYRVSPRRVKVAEILLLAGLGGAALWTSRMVVWWAPVAAYFVAVHGCAAWKTAARKKKQAAPAWKPHVLWTAAAAGILLLAGAVKFYEPALRPDVADLNRARLSRSTPVAAVEHLRNNPPIGQVFNSYEWGDYLLWAGPPDVEVFVASHAHLVPREVWMSYMQVMNQSANWDDHLGRFGANTVLVEKDRRRALVARLREDEQWQLTFEDDIAVVFRRRTPIGAR